ncbi:hypothetical protein PENSPDRAFT_691498 [Peniophora sp. CONT]|nr:hypothetical protein PENSPDRAFT_691498 [Peniophora sp. CONT]
MSDMAQDVEDIAPWLWYLLGCLLTKSGSRGRALAARQHARRDPSLQAVLRDRGNDRGNASREAFEDDDYDSEDELWASFELSSDASRAKEQREDAKEARWLKILDIRRVAAASMFAQTVNQKCNALQCTMGIFLHSCNTPDRVRKVFQSIGLSVSPSTIDRMVTSLSLKASLTRRKIGQTLIALYVFDNVDIDLKIHVPTAEQAAIESLAHLTSGFIAKLGHGVTPDHLRCSRELWEKSALNEDASEIPLAPILDDLLDLHPDREFDATGLDWHDRFNIWKCIDDLIHHGPEYFRRFADELEEPTPIDLIPPTKTEYVPAQTMNINQSTVSGNISAVDTMLAQGGVGDPNDPDRVKVNDLEIVDISEFVALFGGDLGTDERVLGAMDRRSAENTPVRRLQFVIFIMGLFHLKMAATEALWRIFIKPKETQSDASSLRTLAGVLRPTETGKITTKPGYRRMVEVIQHSGIALRLNCWELAAARRNPAWTSLDAFAASKPSLSDLKSMAEEIVRTYIASGDTDLYTMRKRLDADQQHTNTLILQQYLLLFEELSHAMNHGDVGRIETVFPLWIWIFAAVGKHKYASGMTRFLWNVHRVYPQDLSRAIRMNWLINPTGKKGQFRAPDWLNELLNLFQKDTYGGANSNYTVDRIIKESGLVDIYRACTRKIEREFQLTGLTQRHAAKDMRKTLANLGQYLRREARPNEIIPKRKSEHHIADFISKGQSPQARSDAPDTSADDDDDDGGFGEFDWQDLELVN